METPQKKHCRIYLVTFLDPLFLGGRGGNSSSRSLQASRSSATNRCSGWMPQRDQQISSTNSRHRVLRRALGPSTAGCRTEQFCFVFRLFFTGTIVSHVHTIAVVIFEVGEAANRCLEIHEYLHF